MKISLCIPMIPLCLLLCSFSTPDIEKIKVTAEEKIAFDAALDSAGVSPDSFYNQDFLYPKFRSNYYSSRTVENVDSFIAEVIVRNYRRPTHNTENTDSIIKAHEGEETFARLKHGSERQTKFQNFIKSRLTSERMELIRQQRRLASEFCSLNNDMTISLNISKEEAATDGISHLAYDYFTSWLQRTNESIKKHNTDNTVTKIGFGYCSIYFDDNYDNWGKDVIIPMR